jgi:hypothetical protein
MWGPNAERFAHHGAGVLFCLENCHDVGYVKSGGMFPEQMKGEYHAVRRTLEAHWNSYSVIGSTRPGLACGVALVKGPSGRVWSDAIFYVTTGGVKTAYRLDRWD